MSAVSCSVKMIYWIKEMNCTVIISYGLPENLQAFLVNVITKTCNYCWH